MQQRRNEKPTKDPFIKYYILWPIQNVVESVADFFKWVWRTITGAWWCDHCETYHGRRVHKFIYTPNLLERSLGRLVGADINEKHMCSLGRDARYAARAAACQQHSDAEPPDILPTVDVPDPGHNYRHVSDAAQATIDAMTNCIDTLNKLEDLAN